ncbi:MAG: hypothetical protein HRU15_01790, partial [Planctomycetes bacterium]|nr:hypothetical protein [Planctomycetota bacterium]
MLSSAETTYPEDTINQVCQAIAQDSYSASLAGLNDEDRARLQKQWALAKKGVRPADIARIDAALSIINGKQAALNIIVFLGNSIDSLEPTVRAKQIRKLSKMIAQNAINGDSNSISLDERHLLKTFLIISTDFAQWFEQAGLNDKEKLLQALQILCADVQSCTLSNFADIQKMDLEQGVEFITLLSKSLKNALAVYNVQCTDFFHSLKAHGEAIDSNNRILSLSFSLFDKQHHIRLPLIYQGS